MSKFPCFPTFLLAWARWGGGKDGIVERKSLTVRTYLTNINIMTFDSRVNINTVDSQLTRTEVNHFPFRSFHY